VRINISMTTPSEIELGVQDGHLHVGVVPLINPLSGLDYLPLYEEHSLLYCSREHPFFARADSDISEAELRSAEAIAPNYRLTVEAMAQHHALNCTATASDREGIAF
jgi:DNA-binding transcriptional LysR family regulator